ncbi:MAG: ABC transporter permease [Desulfobacterales bacterium]|nr:ABC transporter permease [Desulfobacterales bacterium]
MFLSKQVVNLAYVVYLDSVRMFVNETDALVMMLKASVFGAAIAIIATTTGLQVRGGAEAVGTAATKTVVWSIILIFTFNYLITSIFFGI